MSPEVVINEKFLEARLNAQKLIIEAGGRDDRHEERIQRAVRLKGIAAQLAADGQGKISKLYFEIAENEIKIANL